MDMTKWTFQFSWATAAMMITKDRTNSFGEIVIVEEMLGPDRAIILEFVKWSVHFKQADSANYGGKYFFDDHWWMQDSYEAWQKRLPWLCLRTIKTYFNDLVQCGLLIKKTSVKVAGQTPNFYRPSTNLKPEGKFCTDLPSAEFAQGGGQICTPYPSAEIAPGSYTIKSLVNLTYESENAALAALSPLKLKSHEWAEDDKFAAVFANIYILPSTRRKFSRERVRIWLETIMVEENKTLEDLIRISEKWAKYYQSPGVTVKNALASLGNWIRRDFGDNRIGDRYAAGKSNKRSEKDYAERPEGIDEDMWRKMQTFPSI